MRAIEGLGVDPPEATIPDTNPFDQPSMPLYPPGAGVPSTPPSTESLPGGGVLVIENPYNTTPTSQETNATTLKSTGPTVSVEELLAQARLASLPQKLDLYNEAVKRDQRDPEHLLKVGVAMQKDSRARAAYPDHPLGLIAYGGLETNPIQKVGEVLTLAKERLADLQSQEPSQGVNAEIYALRNEMDRLKSLPPTRTVNDKTVEYFSDTD